MGLEQNTVTAEIKAPLIDIVDAKATTIFNVGTIPISTNHESMMIIINDMTNTTTLTNGSLLIGQWQRMQLGEAIAAMQASPTSIVDVTSTTMVRYIKEGATSVPQDDSFMSLISKLP